MIWTELKTRLFDRSLPGWFEPLSFVLLALGAVSGALFTEGHVIGDGVDLYGTLWFFWWIGDCLVNFRDPSFTDLMFHPLGKDIFAHTGNNFVDAVLAQPFRWLFGFPRYQAWFVWFLLIGNAVSFQPLARQVCKTRAGVWTACALWMLNPFTLFELMCGRITQAFLWFMPLAVWQFMQIGREEVGARGWSRWRAPVLAGVFTGLQGWTYWFGGYFLGMALGVVAVHQIIEMVRARTVNRARLVGWLWAALACAVVVGPAALQMASLSGTGSVPGTGGEVFSIFEPPRALDNNVASSLHGYALQESMGQPMLGYWVWGGALLAILIWGRGYRRWWVLALVAILFSIGTIFPRTLFESLYAEYGPWVLADWWAPAIGASPDTMNPEGLVMPHYMMAYAYLPFFDRLWFPYRMIVMAFFGLSLGLGGLVDRLGTVRKRASVVLGVVLVLGTIAEQSQNLAYPLVHRDMTPPDAYEWIEQEGGGLVEMPMGIGRVSIAWQAVHEQPTFGGMAENASLFWPEGYKERIRDNRFVRELRKVTRNPNDFSCCEHPAMMAGIEALKGDGFRWLVLDRHLVDADLHRYAYGRDARPDQIQAAPFDVQARLIQALGDPVAVDGELVIWDLKGGADPPEALLPTENNLSVRSWPMDDMPAYEAHLRALGRIK